MSAAEVAGVWSYSTLPAAAAQVTRLFSTGCLAVLKTEGGRDWPVKEISGYLRVRLQHGLPALAALDHSPLLRAAQRAEEDVAGGGEYRMAMMNPLCGTGASSESGGGREQRSRFFKWTRVKSLFSFPIM